MSLLVCPICKARLIDGGGELKCENNHSFDKAKSGYVNLLLSQARKERRHGDDKLMVRARNDFLEKGYYKILLIKVLEIIDGLGKKNPAILDGGCGEGYYIRNIADHLKGRGETPVILCTDISKDAIEFLAKKRKDIMPFVASVFKLPVADRSIDIVLSMFAPFDGEEVKRVLKNDGVFVRAYPLEKHLMGLKAVVYDRPYENSMENAGIKGLTVQKRYAVKGKISLRDKNDIESLFMMTPYYYKTSREDQEKLKSVNELTTDIEFGVDVYAG